MRSRETGSRAGKSRASPDVFFFFGHVSVVVCVTISLCPSDGGTSCGLVVALLWWMFLF